jgi:hypothetical protein
MAAYSSATSGIRTSADPSKCMGNPSHKKFILPSDEILLALEIAEYPFNLHDPAKELHNMPGIQNNSLLCTGKFADANYITIFVKGEVNIYDANDTGITVTHSAILHGWRDPQSNLWRILQVNVVCNNNIDTVIMNKPPSECLLACPPLSEAIHSIYKLKT